MKKLTKAVIGTGLAVAGTVGALKYEAQPEHIGPTPTELDQVRKVGDVAMRANMVEIGRLSPSNNDLMAITIHEGEPSPGGADTGRFIHIVRPNETAESIDSRYSDDHMVHASQVDYLEEQGSGPDHGLQVGDPVLLPETGMDVPQKQSN